MIDLWGKVSAAERREARRILKQVECEYLASRRWGVLSQGERQRVLIGRALMAHPKLLILDEPCAGLDAETERAFFATLNDSAMGRTIILIAHRLTGAERLDRIWRLSEGRATAAAG